MRILVVTHNYPRFPGDPAGAYVARLARAAAVAGNQVRVVAPHVAGTATEETDGAVGVSRFRYAPERLERVGYRGDLHRRALRSPLVALGLPAFLWSFRRAVARAARELGPDVIHAHWWLPGGLMAGGMRLPYLVTCHGSDVRLLERSTMLRRVARSVLGGAAAVTTVSRFLATDLRRLLGAAAGAVTVTPMPVDVELFTAGELVPRANPPRILYAGNLLASKGVDVLVRAFALLRGRGVPCALRLIGEGPAEGELRALAGRLGVAAEVAWSPFVAQSTMPAEYGASTVTVLPTRGQAEGLGLTLVEALLAGCAVVGTPAGGIPEVVLHEETGLLARDADADDLASQIGRLLADGALRERLIRAGRERVRSIYAPEVAATRFLELYRQAAGKRRAA